MNNMGWKADSLNIKQSCKEYAMSLGIDNSPVIRQATAEEMMEFDNIKPYKGWTEADKYNVVAMAQRQNGYSSKTPMKNPQSTITQLRAKGKIYHENRV